MSPGELLTTVVKPTLAWMGERYAGELAEVMLVAIAAHESDCTHCRQLGDGPARGFWMFEPNGVSGVLGHERTADDAARIARLSGVNPRVPRTIWAAMETDHRLACAFARLLLWSHPHPLPALCANDVAYRQYDALWRPGAKRPDAWARSYGAALDVVLAPEREIADA